MKPFKTIRTWAETRKGGPEALSVLLPPVPDQAALAQVGDDRVLAQMCRAINQSGFNWRVIDNKWPQFEEAFFGFDVARLSNLSPEDWEGYLNDTRVVRHGRKIMAVAHNVQYVASLAREYGSAAAFIANWPTADQIGLQAHFKKHGKFLGGFTGVMVLRYLGKDCFNTSRDVVRALQEAGLDIADEPKSKRDLTKIQDAFKTWHAETGLPYTHLSKIAAYSTGTNYDPSEILARTSPSPDQPS